MTKIMLQKKLYFQERKVLNAVYVYTCLRITEIFRY